jgi:large subunit ribosomal protein L9
MKVVMLQNVPKVGKKYELIEVANGYGRNFLIPRGLAEIVTRDNMGRIAELTKRRALEAEKEAKRLAEAKDKLASITLSFVREANEEGHTYEGVSGRDIAAKIEEVLGVAIEASSIILSKAIKELGDHKVEVAIAGSNVPVTVTVVAA